jgi:hypothetical protein
MSGRTQAGRGEYIPRGFNVHGSPSLSLHLFVSPSLCLFVPSSLHLSISPSLCPFVSPFLCLLVSLVSSFVHPFAICLFASSFLRLTVSLSLHLSVTLFSVSPVSSSPCLLVSSSRSLHSHHQVIFKILRICFTTSKFLISLSVPGSQLHNFSHVSQPFSLIIKLFSTLRQFVS